MPVFKGDVGVRIRPFIGAPRVDGNRPHTSIFTVQPCGEDHITQASERETREAADVLVVMWDQAVIDKGLKVHVAEALLGRRGTWC